MLDAEYLLPGASFKWAKQASKQTDRLPFTSTADSILSTVDKQETGELIAQLCLDKVGQSPQVPSPQAGQSVSFLIDLGAAKSYSDDMCPSRVSDEVED